LRKEQLVMVQVSTTLTVPPNRATAVRLLVNEPVIPNEVGVPPLDERSTSKVPAMGVKRSMPPS